MTDTTTQSLAEWLLDRIAEDETVARTRHDLDCDLVRNGVPDPTWGWECDCGYPDRVLAECAAKRRIVELHWPDHECTDGSRNYPGVFAGDPALGMVVCPTLRALASVYADAPGFREEWRP